MKSERWKVLVMRVGLVVVAAFLFMVLFQFVPAFFPLHYEAALAIPQEEIPVVPVVPHLDTPLPVKAIYMSQCLASDKVLRSNLVALINETELNSVVIDIKDYSGRIGYISELPYWSETISRECFVRDMKEFLAELHRDGIYTIARITVFQDPFMASRHPEWAVKRASDNALLWKDRKGISYIDPGAHVMWEEIVALSREAYSIGFDEINFDYIRFPSDGNMNDIYYPYSEARITADSEHGKSSVLREFFAFLNRELKKDNIVISADVFGMTTTNTDDLNIGQILEDAVEYFDFVAPMVYPSHYPTGFIGITNPAAEPYKVIKYSMDSAVRRASTTPLKLRPWLQDFHLGATYTPEMVRAQMQATYDSGLDSWMLWNASNRYTKEALDLEM